MSCPRCGAGADNCRTEYQGMEDGAVVWTILFCTTCSFSWRDTEPARTIDPAQREEWSRVYPDQPERYIAAIPAAKPGG